MCYHATKHLYYICTYFLGYSVPCHLRNLSLFCRVHTERVKQFENKLTRSQEKFHNKIVSSVSQKVLCEIAQNLK